MRSVSERVIAIKHIRHVSLLPRLLGLVAFAALRVLAWAVILLVFDMMSLQK